MSATCATMRAPTTTSPAAATSSGTTWVSGVRNIDARNSRPVTTEAMPVRAPSPMPDAESMNTVFDDTEAPPPATAPTPSTTSADFRRGKVPSGFATPAAFASPVIVPIASKKFVKTRVKTSIDAATGPMRVKAPKTSACPTSDRSGRAKRAFGRPGALRFQPVGESTEVGTLKIACRMIATIVVPTMPMSSAPLTLRAMSVPMTTRPIRNTIVGRAATEPSSPSCSGGEAFFVVRTNPESTRPMNAMNRPMPTVIAALSCAGTAVKIIVRMPVSARITITTPLMTTRPIASAQVTWCTTLTARNELIPRPAAMPNGRFATRPIAIVITPATRPVAAATCAFCNQPPRTSCGAWSWLNPPRISGLRMTMYAIVTKETRPPRISRGMLDPRCVIEKKRSRPDAKRFRGGVSVCWALTERVYRTLGARRVALARPC